MNKKLALLHKSLSILSSFLIIFQTFLPAVTLFSNSPVFAQEAVEVPAEAVVTPTTAEVTLETNAVESETVAQAVEPSPTPEVSVSPASSPASPNRGESQGGPAPTIEVTITPEPTPTPTPPPVDEPTSEPSVPQTSTIDQAIQSIVASVVETVSGWQQNPDGSYTTASVQLGETYKYPGNEKVSLVFTKLQESGSLTIKEIKLTAEQIQESGSLSDTAYDITSSMQNGTFEYNLTLPRPQVSTSNPLEVRFSEDENNLDNAEKVSEETKVETDIIKVTGLDHFTVFLISASTVGGVYTTITGPTLVEATLGDISTGTIILNVPSGFVFDTTTNSVIATVTPSSCTGDTQLKLDAGSLTQTVTPTTTTITFDVFSVSNTDNSCISTITFSGIKARPTATAPVVMGDITRTGTATIGTTTYSTETLQEIAAITAINTAKADGSYKAGEVIDITLTYTENVNVTGTPTIALNSGGTASYLSGSGTSTLTFRYTVGGSDSSADLAHTATNSLALNGGTIRDGVNSGDVDNTLLATTTFSGVHAIVIDTVAPSAPTIFSIATNNLINNAEKAAIVVAGTAEADSLVSVTLSDGSNSVTGTQQLSGGATSFSITLDGTATSPAALSDGTIVPSATATDGAGNTSSATTNPSATQDTVAPAFSSVLPTSNSAINNITTSSDISYTLDGNVASGVVTITRTSGTVDGSSPHTCTLVGTALNFGAHTLDLSDTTNGCSQAQTLVDGAIYTFSFDATDSAGNSASTITRTNIIYDITEPSSATLSINSGASYTNSTSVTLTISATDATSLVTEMNIYNGTAFNANNWESYATSKSWTLPSTEGTKTVRARFRDAAGNENSTNLTSDTIILDTTVPVISDVSVNNVTTSNNTYVKNGDTVNVTATITDANQASFTTSNITANLSTLGGGASVNPSSYNTSTGVATWSSLTVSGTTDGNIGAAVSALDPASNSATPVSDAILADNTAPTGSITAPSNNAYSNVNPSFTATGSDTNGIASIKFQYKAASAGSYTDLNTDTTSIYAADWTGVTLTTNTVYNLQIVITDAAGNTTTVTTVSFTYDTTAPNLTITSPVTGTTTTSTVSVNLTTNETTSCTYSLDSGSATALSTTGGTTHSHSLSSLSTGSHTLQLTCTDLASNSTTSSTISFTVSASSGSTIDASSTSPSFDSATDGQADLPSGVTSLTLSDSTNLNLSSGVSNATGGNITVGGSTIALNNFTSGNLSGVNLSIAQTIGGQTVNVDKAVKLESGTNGTPIVLQNTNLSNTSVSIPDGATILAPSGWNGTIQPPKTGTSTGTFPSGYSFDGNSMEVGSPDVTLLFDTPVTLTFAGTGDVAYRSAGSSSWTRIEAQCAGTYASPVAPAFPGECYISNGENTKVYTYHFTTFAVVRGGSPPSASTASSTCSDTKPASAPTLLSAVPGNNQVTLTWSKATDPVSYYLIAYGTSSGTLQYGNPNVGGKDTTSFTVSGLSGGTTYYFKVRAGNGCMPGDFSSELSAAPTGEVVIGGVAEGFAQGVLGESVVDDESEDSEEKDTEDKNGKDEESADEEVLGKENEGENQTGTLSKARTILPIALVLALLAGFGFWFFRKPR